MRFTGKVAIISGASRGIGKETALLLGREGASVVVNYKSNRVAADSVAAEIDAGPGNAIVVQADIEDPDQIVAMYERVKERYGKVDIVVANAAASAFKPLEALKTHHIDRTMKLTVHGFLNLAQQAIPIMPSGGPHHCGLRLGFISLSGRSWAARCREGRAGIVGPIPRCRAWLARYQRDRRVPGSDRDGLREDLRESPSARLGILPADVASLYAVGSLRTSGRDRGDHRLPCLARLELDHRTNLRR